MSAFVPLVGWRYVDRESANFHLGDVSGLEEQSQQRRPKMELANSDQWLLVPGGPLIVLRKNAQATPGHFESTSDAYLQGIQLYVAVESGAQRLYNPSL